ncbi:hypothetical protein SY86_15195 [Erwinia tracheiphila]|uniref:Uncharacterized protein n=1 Tax=Erwinia tracheiphila TaxID=65700 RepID=A0A0M2KGX6_9GAMM|nr:hypothetical protein ETR_17996 [Erwinia tracheiphila PSU-1]KKF36478.1 hypothetical protein SY86_15195 [Erwinia tracheiphila]
MFVLSFMLSYCGRTLLAMSGCLHGLLIKDLRFLNQRYNDMRWQIKNEILSLQEESKFHQSHLRLSALNVAAVLSPQKELGSLKNDADALLKWALFGF